MTSLTMDEVSKGGSEGGADILKSITDDSNENTKSLTSSINTDSITNSTSSLLVTIGGSKPESPELNAIILKK